MSFFMLILMAICIAIIVACNYGSFKLIEASRNTQNESTTRMVGRGLARGVGNMALLAILACAWFGFTALSYQLGQSVGFSDVHTLPMISLGVGVLNGLFLCLILAGLF